MSFNCFMHERNIYKDRPNFSKIAIDYPEFKKYALPDRKGKFRIDFNDPNALRTLTRILLKKDFDLNVEIPDGYLIPTVPQRLNYILWIEDLLTVLPQKSATISGIDIGTGPCAILSLLGSKKNGWHYVSTETSEEAVQLAKKNIEKNNLQSNIKVSKVNKGTVLHEVLVESEVNFDFCVCNPPFFENKDDIRKKSSRRKEILDLYAKKEEIFSDGGEVSFVKQLLKDSLMFKNRIGLYSSMFGKKKSFLEMLKELQGVEGITYTKTEFCQGNTIRWGIAWTFLKDVNFGKIERPKPKKHKKPKPPLVLSIIRQQKDGNILFLQEILENIKSVLLKLQIQTKIIKSVGNYAEIEILSYENTWSHQRRKRREQQKGTVHEIDAKDDIHSKISIKKLDASATMLEKEAPNSSKNLPHSEISLTDLEQGQVAGAEAKPIMPTERDEEQGNIPKTKPVSLSTGNKIEAAVSSESLQDTVSQKRKRDDDEPVLDVNSDVLHKQENKCILQENLDCGESPTIKKLKISIDTDVLPGSLPDSVSQKRKRDEDELALDKSSDKLPDQDNKCAIQENSDSSTSPEVKRLKFSKEAIPSVKNESESSLKEDESFPQSHQDCKGSNPEKVPLLYCILKLRTTKEVISLEMNCSPEHNRETMYQVFQLFRNKFGPC